VVGDNVALLFARADVDTKLERKGLEESRYGPAMRACLSWPKHVSGQGPYVTTSFIRVPFGIAPLPAWHDACWQALQLYDVSNAWRASSYTCSIIYKEQPASVFHASYDCFTVKVPVAVNSSVMHLEMALFNDDRNGAAK
jgi:hypothetical protein